MRWWICYCCKRFSSCKNWQIQIQKFSLIWWLLYIIWSNPHNSVFWSIGKILEGSGAAYFLSEANIADGSINKFLTEKSYNHCRSRNLLLVPAIHGLHLEIFVANMNISSTNFLQKLENRANGKDMSEVPSNLHDMVTKYDLYLEETLNRKIGKTAQFRMTYTKIAELI